MNKKILFVVPMVALVLAGCNTRGGSSTSGSTPTTSSGGTTSETPSVVHTTGVFVDAYNVSVNLGEEVTIGAHVLPENATDQGLKFSIDKPNIAEVNETSGKVTPKEAGSATVTIKDHETETFSKTVTLTVVDPSFHVPSETSDGYSLVTDASKLKEDDEIYFVGVNGSDVYSMKTYDSGNNIKAVADTVSAEKLVVGEGAGNYKLVAATGGFYVKDTNDKYLQVTKGSNYLKAVDTPNNACLFTIASDGDVVDFACNVDGEGRYIRFNINIRDGVASPMFSAYKADSSVQQKVNLYVKAAVVKSLTKIEVVTPKTDYSQGDEFVKPTVKATFTSSEGEEVLDVTSEAVFTGYDMSQEGEQTVTVSYTYKDHEETTTYKINVAGDTLQSIGFVVGSDMTKKTYKDSEEWDPEGLQVFGHYSIGGDKPIPLTDEKLSLSYDPVKPNSTSITEVTVTATYETLEAIKVVEGITVYHPTSMQLAYEAVEALEPGNVTSEQTFSGVIIGVQGNTFFVQDGNYGMMIYGGKTAYASSEDVGKEVEIKSTLQNYNGCFETKTISSVTLGSTGTLPTPTLITNVDQLNDLKQNILVNVSEFIAEKDYNWSDISKDYTVNPLLDGKPAALYCSKYLNDSSLAAAINSVCNGNKFSVTSAVYSINYSAKQIALVNCSNVEVVGEPATEIVCIPSATEVEVDNKITLSASFNGKHTAEPTFDIVEGKDTYATISGNEITAVAEGIVKVKAYCSDPVLESELVTITVTPSSGVKELTVAFDKGVYDSTAKDITWTESVIVIHQEKGSGSSDVNGSYVSAPRWYQGHLITFTPATGYKIVGMTFTSTDDKYAKALGDSTWSSGACVASGKTATWTGECTAPFTVSMASQSRPASLVISYCVIE